MSCKSDFRCSSTILHSLTINLFPSKRNHRHATPLRLFPGFPQELQDAIVQLVAKAERPYMGDQLSLSSTCKSLRSICLPLIYSTIHLYSEPEPPRGALLVRTLSTSPVQAGKHIKHLALDGLDLEHKPPEAIIPHTYNVTEHDWTTPEVCSRTY